MKHEYVMDRINNGGNFLAAIIDSARVEQHDRYNYQTLSLGFKFGSYAVGYSCEEGEGEAIFARNKIMTPEKLIGLPVLLTTQNNMSQLACIMGNTPWDLMPGEEQEFYTNCAMEAAINRLSDTFTRLMHIICFSGLQNEPIDYSVQAITEVIDSYSRIFDEYDVNYVWEKALQRFGNNTASFTYLDDNDGKIREDSILQNGLRFYFNAKKLEVKEKENK